MDPKLLAQMIAEEIDKRLETYAKRAWYRGVVTAATGQRCSVEIEGQDNAMPNLLAIKSYTPVIGHQVLIANIGTTGSNFIVMGRLDLS